MKRREFLNATTSMVLPLTLGGFSFKHLNKNSALVKSVMKTQALESDRALVIVYLNGGNDGLNTVIPLESYSNYYNLRSNIAIPESKVLKLAGNLETGLHPSMPGMQALYNEGKLGIIHSVSYPNPNQSHYRSSDIFMTGVSSDQYSESGWAARYLDSSFPNYPEAYPNSNMPDPLAIQIGYMNTTTLLRNQQAMNVAVQDPQSFYSMMGRIGEVPDLDIPCCDAGDQIRYIREQQVLSIGFSEEIKRAAETGKNMATYPTASSANDLSEQLKIVARLIHGGLKSKIYYVELGGFDTHAGQVGSDTTQGAHAVLLQKLSSAISAFQNDLKLMGIEDRVIGLTFSDFGRRATSNISKGTDHGVGAPMFVFGTGIKRQIVGTNPDLVFDLEPPFSGAANQNYDIKMQIDFRRVYADILNDWFGNNRSVTDTILFGNHRTTSLFSNVIETVKSGSWADRSIWTANRMPGQGDYVKINTGHTIDLGQSITVKDIEVTSGGTLKFLGNYKVNTTG